MKLFPLIAVLFLSSYPCLVAAQDTDEILIEMHGTSAEQPRPTPMLWDYNARQLSNKWRGKTREQLLYTVPVVSDRDGIVRGPKAEYMLVEYFTDGQFRKFLFRAETPQTFIAAAATPADVLAINKKYGINIGLTLSDFQTAYQTRAQMIVDDNLPKNATLYQLAYSDINTPAAQQNWFLFEDKKLTRTFYTQAEKDAYLKDLQEQAKQKEISPAPTPKPAGKQPVPFKALISGGTLHDQMYLPRMVNPNPNIFPQNTQKK